MLLFSVDIDLETLNKFSVWFYFIFALICMCVLVWRDYFSICDF